MSLGLSINDVVNTQVIFTPLAAQTRNFGNLMIVGSSAVIDVSQRFRLYSSLTQVAGDFPANSAEYQAAQVFFGQSPQPVQVYIGRWAQTATPGILHGGPISAANQATSVWTAIANGSTQITVDGTLRVLSGLNFSAITNMNGVASVINTALGSNGSCIWNSNLNRFDIKGLATGIGVQASGTVTFSANPTANDTLTINGVAITFVSGTPSGNQVQIAGSATATAANLLAFLQSATGGLAACTYTLNVAQTVLTITAVTFVAATGNAIALAKSSTALTLSGATLAGGVNAGTMSYGSATGSGTDITTLAGLTAVTNAIVVQGINAETLLSAVTTLANMSNDWYGIYNADITDAQVSDYLAVAGFIQAANPVRILGITTQDTNTLINGNTTSLAYQLSQLLYSRTFIQYSSQNNQAAVSIFGRLFTVNPLGNNTMLTIKFKQEPGVIAEQLTEAQAQALLSVNCNVFVAYNNSTSIIQPGIMSGAFYIDEIWGTDWLSNYIQTNVYNLLYGSPTKIPQTDAGVNLITNNIAQSCQQAVVNGLVAPGVWTGPAIGNLQPGQSLSSGFYIFAPPIASQTTGQRASRQAPSIQVCVKLAGAIHSALIAINVNR